MKYLVPLARANRADGERLADAAAPLRRTTRQMVIVHAAWLGANAEGRALMQDLFDEMYASPADRSSRKLLNRLARVDVLVIDEMGYLNLRPTAGGTISATVSGGLSSYAGSTSNGVSSSSWGAWLGSYSF